MARITNPQSPQLSHTQPNRPPPNKTKGHSTMTQDYLKQIYLRRDRPNSPPVKVSFVTTGHGHAAYINVQTNDGLAFSIGSSRKLILHLLNRLISELEISSIAERGIIHGEAEAFNFITLDDLKENLSDEQKLLLLIERFRDSSADIYNGLLADYEAKAGHKYNSSKIEKGGAAESPPPLSIPSQLHNDLQTISSYLPQLLQDNKLIRGSRTRIAEILNIPNGGSSYKRIKAVAQEIEQQHEKAA
jgi:hypothetical protein